MDDVFTVALVGRPNVGKSTLFNRLIGKKIAIVDDRAGVTRDRREGFCNFSDAYIRVFDTAGYEDEKGQSLEARMQQQTEIAVREADLCLFILDSRSGVTPMDATFARFLRKKGANVMVVANKSENQSAIDILPEAVRLGFGEPLFISAEHGENIVLMMQEILAKGGDKIKSLSETVEQERRETLSDEEIEYAAENNIDLTWVDPEGSVRVGIDRPLRISIIGRPNAGKSTLINQILGEERLLTGAEAGITRDSIKVDHEYNGQKIMLFDTAGLRKKSNIDEKLEKLSVADTLRTLQYTEVAVILLDAQTAFEKQDLQIIELAEKEGRAVVIVINKWDTVEDPSKMAQILREKCARLLPQLKSVPVVLVSALSGRGIDKLFQAVFEIYEQWNGRASTSLLNRWLEGALQAHPAPLVSGRRLKLKYITQVKTRPPTFVVFSTKADKLPDSYKRYLVNGLREEFDFKGTPIRLEVRARKNPFANK